MATDWHADGVYGELPPYSYLYPCIALVTRGKLLDWWIHKHYKAFNVVTKIYYPENPRTGRQQGNRTVLYDAVKNWQGFDEETKRYYNQLIRPTHMAGYNRYLSLYLEANYPMIIYWESLKQSETQNVTIPDYIASPYFGSACYPASNNRLVGLGPSGDLVLPRNLAVGSDGGELATRIFSTETKTINESIDDGFAATITVYPRYTYG